MSEVLLHFSLLSQEIASSSATPSAHIAVVSSSCSSKLSQKRSSRSHHGVFFLHHHFPLNLYSVIIYFISTKMYEVEVYEIILK